VNAPRKNPRPSANSPASAAGARRHQQEGQEAQAQAQALRNGARRPHSRCATSPGTSGDQKRRTDLNDGEKAELLRFEENFKSRCG
jgi:hypothetical protein